MKESKYTYLTGRITRLDNQLSEIKCMLSQMKAGKKKHLLEFEECIPPRSVCVDALSMLGVKNYKGMMRLLGDYYGIARLQLYHQPNKVPKGAIACYVRSEGTAYSKKGIIETNTVLHEFFHHLHSNNVVMLYSGDDEEKLAEEYSRIFLERGKET